MPIIKRKSPYKRKSSHKRKSQPRTIADRRRPVKFIRVVDGAPPFRVPLGGGVYQRGGGYPPLKAESRVQ